MKQVIILLIMILAFSTISVKSSSDVSLDSARVVQDSVKQYSFLVDIDDRETEVTIYLNDPLVAKRPVILNITGLTEWGGVLKDVDVYAFFSNHTEAFEFSNLVYLSWQFRSLQFGLDRFSVGGDYYLFIELRETVFFSVKIIGNYTTPVFQVQDREKVEYQFDIESQIEQGTKYAFYLSASDPYGEQFVVSQFQFQKTDSNIQQFLDFEELNASSWRLDFETKDLAVGKYNYSFVLRTIDAWLYFWVEYLTITGEFVVQEPLLGTGFELGIVLVGLMVLMIKRCKREKARK